LESRGIPAFTDRGEGFFETIEIDTFLGLLKVIDNFRQDVPLAAAMCSAVFGFALSDLGLIRAEKKDGAFYTAVLRYAEMGGDAALRGKCQAMRERILRWRSEERFMRLDEFLWKLMCESGYYDYVGSLAFGGQRRANLRALLDRAADFQQGRVRGLYSFISYIDTVRETVSVPQVKLLSEGENVVRIMTIHGSKGLEFPAVIQCGLGKSLRRGGGKDLKVLFHREAGIALDWEDYETHTHKKTLLHAVLKQRKAIDERAEDIRLLYVGMTRAMDRLYLIGTLSKAEETLALYEGADPAADTDVMGAPNYLKMILPTAMARRDCFETEIPAPGHVCGAGEPDENAGAGAETCAGAAAMLDGMSAAGKENPLVEERFGYRYPYESAARVKSKYSVTALTAHTGGPRYFMAGSATETDEDAGLTAAEKGTALHKALEILDFAEAYARRDERVFFEEFLAGLEKDAVLTKAEADSIGRETLMIFAGSALCRRAAAAVFVRKEAPFNMKVPYAEAFPDAPLPAAEDIMIQGVIDCLFEEEDGIVIADYKSGRYRPGGGEDARVRAAYGGQAALYRKAAGLIFDKPIKETLIYMTRAGVCVEIP
ncbi:MAG: PD-(D/E)XK nuclease family protein, partial [Clostridiales Family XIII bacterium]|nr:PD-(D/E)XK nuclease family protein [Clostridiales Family XIII bacterium]